jgi:uncharacterized protein (DUF433 family)
MAKTAAARIAREVHDEPHIAGRRVTVRRIQGLVEGAEQSPVEVADDLELEPADVYAALHYYHTHPEEMAEAEKQHQKRVERAAASGAKSLAEYEENGAADTR